MLCHNLHKEVILCRAPQCIMVRYRKGIRLSCPTREKLDHPSTGQNLLMAGDDLLDAPTGTAVATWSETGQGILGTKEGKRLSHRGKNHYQHRVVLIENVSWKCRQKSARTWRVTKTLCSAAFPMDRQFCLRDMDAGIKTDIWSVMEDFAKVPGVKEKRNRKPKFQCGLLLLKPT